MHLPKNIKSIIIFRALQLGDTLCAVPAIRALRHAYPCAIITLAGMPWAASFTERFNKYFDDFIWFPGYPGLPEQELNPAAFTEFLSIVQNRKFDLAIQLQGNGSIVNPMIKLFGAKITAGYFKKEAYAPNRDYFMEYPDYGSEIDRHLLLMDFLGVPPQGNNLEFPVTDQDQKDLESLGLGIKSKKYICIHPGSRGAWRQWPVAHFAAIADYYAEAGFQIVVTGTKAEQDLVESVIAHMHYPAINAAGKTNLSAMAILIRDACALVSNCTGVSHIAAAFQTPSIVISMDGEPERWGPINKHLHKTINWLLEPGFDYVLNQAALLLHPVNKV
ncbi:ADP-heptose:LPS heptosyltransferase [Mucilaginibacter pineti]|uniref:ADP-heptose:LPS heptosyltransferase n=1 Tax=Mucilaginibacter pineti TaxID=1391627 RepID=A0A1G7H731_9SPHI|nr:glycosyltransferase family 9 protein [Mucilaginibacter pineti]SDE96250.1 ADP-heptose:LPS heptosyltransferase [Mucilaginibacter pineti]